jgi:hypothetical protein
MLSLLDVGFANAPPPSRHVEIPPLPAVHPASPPRTSHLRETRPPSEEHVKEVRTMMRARPPRRALPLTGPTLSSPSAASPNLERD